VINVTNVDPTTPTDGNSAANSIPEGTANGTPVGITAAALDINGPAVIYSLTGGAAGGRFAIDSSTGVVTVANSTLLNTATGASHSITVQASDGVGGISTASFTIWVTNVLPTSNAGGPYSVTDAGLVTLLGSGADPVGPVSYAWDLDNNGTFETAGQNVSFNPRLLVPVLGLKTVKVRVTDDEGTSTVATSTVNVTDDDTAGPSITLGGSTGTQTDIATQAFTWSTADPSGISSVAVIVKRGTTVIYSSTSATTSGGYNFDAYGPGTYTLNVTAIDADNDRTGDTATTIAPTRTVIVTSAGVSGGIGNDYIRVRPTNAALPAGEVKAFNVTFVGTVATETLMGVFPTTKAIVINGNGGNDTIEVVGNITRNVRFYGGTGNDVLTGGNGHDVLNGGDGNDVLTGKLGNDLLIGGIGADRLLGGSATGNTATTGDENLLIGDKTIYDVNDAALAALLTEWSNTAKTSAARIATLRAGVAYLGGTAKLVANTTIVNDNAVDQLFGTNSFTWFWNISPTTSVTKDVITGKRLLDIVN